VGFTVDLKSFRPGPDEWNSASSYDWCLRLARAHYENFPVASLLLPRDLRPDVAALYAFARIADDIADEPGLSARQRLTYLSEWENSLDECTTGTPSHPAFIALGQTIARRRLPILLFHDLLSAFRQDVTTCRYETFNDVLEYCGRSANPVGRLLLRLFEYDDAGLDRQSDAICTALQLTNFWQDFSQDLARNRVYVPAEDFRRFGLSPEPEAGGWDERPFRDLVAFQVTRTRGLFAAGRPLIFEPKTRLSYQLRLTWHGGMRILEKIERSGYTVLRRRPRLVGIDAAVILTRAFLGS